MLFWKCIKLAMWTILKILIELIINKGRSLSQLHRFEEAISNYDRELKINPQNTDAYINKGLSLYNLGKNAEAIIYFDKVLTVEPNNLLALNLKHRAELNLKGVP